MLKPCYTKHIYKIALGLFSTLPIAKDESSRKAQELLLLNPQKTTCFFYKWFSDFMLLSLETLAEQPVLIN